MKQRFSILFLILIAIYSCAQNEEQKKEAKESKIEIKKERISKKERFQNIIKIDTTQNNKNAIDFLMVSNSIKSDSIISICNCDKDKKNNSIKIQLETGIPTKKELDTMSENSKKWNRVLQTRDLGYLTKLTGQFKFLTIVLKDSIVKSIDIYSKSTEKEYNGSDFDSLSIERYKINISKFDYSIASDIYGDFELRLNKEFGLFPNDTILKGTFICNNWIISDKEKIRNWDINKKSKESSIE
jgi:hypothetical protein